MIQLLPSHNANGDRDRETQMAREAVATPEERSNGNVDRTLEESRRVREEILRTLMDSEERTTKIKKSLRKAGYPV